MDENAEVSRFVALLQASYDANPVFPTFLSVSIEIKRTLEKEDYSFDEIVAVIKKEPLITAKLLGLANSAFYSQGMPVKDLRAATQRLGVNLVRAVAFSVASQQLVKAESLRPVVSEILQLWSHTIEVAYWSYTLSAYYKIGTPDEALLFGFLQDLGKLCILAKAADSPKILDQREEFVETVRRWHLYVEKNVMGALNMGHAVVEGRSLIVPPESLQDIIFIATLLAEGQDPFFKEHIDALADILPLKELNEARVQVEARLQNLF